MDDLFLVYSNGLTTKVLGTVFKISSSEQENKVIVDVLSGIVSVFSLPDKKSKDVEVSNKFSTLVLTRNQKASFSKQDNSLVTSIVDKPVLKAEEKHIYHFNKTPVKKVFDAIERDYGVNVIYDDKTLSVAT